MASRLKVTTFKNKVFAINNLLRPAFTDTPINEIKPADIRKWQEDVLKKGYKKSSLKNFHICLSSLFNYAIKFHGLTLNPARIAGNAGKTVKRLDFWTPSQFRRFMFALPDVPSRKRSGIHEKITIYETLFWTGCRIGELLALTVDDIDLKRGIIDINKDLVHHDGRDIIQTPKTQKSCRKILLPAVLVAILKDWIERASLKGSNRLFSFSASNIQTTMKKATELANLPSLTPHGLRHSHASLLIELNAPILIISERLGHDSVETTLKIYAHLFPNKQETIVAMLDNSPL